MEVLRVNVSGWTASYRYPPFVVGTQPTLPIPPLSTIYGLISAAAGKIIDPAETKVGVVSNSEAKARDLEKIYQIAKNGQVSKTNVFEREFLYKPDIFLYLTNLDFENYFKSPKYPLLLGRTDNLAFIKSIKKIKLKSTNKVDFKNTLIPFPQKNVSTPFFALPKCFSNSIPRRTISVGAFFLIDNVTLKSKTEEYFLDEEKQWGVFLHEPKSFSQIKRGDT